MNKEPKTKISLMVGCLCVLTFAACAHNRVEGGKWVNPKEVNKMIKKKGAQVVLAEAYNNAWDQILTNIATGEVKWLNIASEFYNVSDAGASEQLQLAIGEALDNRPVEVFRLLERVSRPPYSLKKHVFNITVCTEVDIDDKRFDSAELAFEEVEKRKKAVSEVVELEFQDQKSACLQLLEKSKSGILRFYGKSESGDNQSE